MTLTENLPSVWLIPDGRYYGQCQGKRVTFMVEFNSGERSFWFNATSRYAGPVIVQISGGSISYQKANS